MPTKRRRVARLKVAFAQAERYHLLLGDCLAACDVCGERVELPHGGFANLLDPQRAGAIWTEHRRALIAEHWPHPFPPAADVLLMGAALPEPSDDWSADARKAHRFVEDAVAVHRARGWR